jgi:hypothetical protein
MQKQRAYEPPIPDLGLGAAQNEKAQLLRRPGLFFVPILIVSGLGKLLATSKGGVAHTS